MPPNPALQQVIRNLSRLETQDKEKTYKNKPKTIKKMAIGTYISIITLNVNELNVLKLKTKTGWMDLKLRPTYMLQEWVYKRPTSDLGTHREWKWGSSKRYSMQMAIKRKLE